MARTARALGLTLTLVASAAWACGSTSTVTPHSTATATAGVASPSATPSPTPTASASLGTPAATSGAAGAYRAVQTYVGDLLGGRYENAWNLLGLGCQARWGSLAAFTKERTAFLKQAGAQFKLQISPANTLLAWQLDRRRELGVQDRSGQRLPVQPPLGRVRGGSPGNRDLDRQSDDDRLGPLPGQLAVRRPVRAAAVLRASGPRSPRRASSMNASQETPFSCSPARLRMATVRPSISRSPRTSMYGTFCSWARRILFCIRLSESSTSTRSFAARMQARQLPGAIDVPVGDGDEDGLHRRTPDREGAGEVLDQHADEALQRAVDGAMDRHRPDGSGRSRRCRCSRTARAASPGPPGSWPSATRVPGRRRSGCRSWARRRPRRLA